MLQRWPRATVRVPTSARYKAYPEDFEVCELPGVSPTGAGEHLLLEIEKRELTTPDVVRALARHFAVPATAIGYAGLKDKQAVARQWLSVQSPGEIEPGAAVPVGAGAIRVLAAVRHERKLRRGDLAGNAFRVRLSAIGDDGWRDALPRLRVEGAPNYFGPQRFGRDNFSRARAWLPERRRRRVSRFQQGLNLSVLRSYLFNEVLAARVREGTWRTLICGDVVDGGGPTGPLWGRGRSAAAGRAGAVEQAALATLDDVRDGLEHAGLAQERRPLAARATSLDWVEEDSDSLLVSFTLPPGTYATSLLREAFALTSGDDDEPI